MSKGRIDLEYGNPITDLISSILGMVIPFMLQMILILPNIPWELDGILSSGWASNWNMAIINARTLTTLTPLLYSLRLRSRTKPMRYIVLGFAYILFVLLCEVTWARDVAIIVHRDNTTSELSLEEVSKIFAQERQYWEIGKKIYLVLQEAGSPEKQVVLRKIYRKANDDE